MIDITLDTWLISDTHFGHMNMIKLCGRPPQFNDIIHKNWVKRIKENDTVLHLGDLAMWRGPTRDLWHNFAAELPGIKYMIRGNHDELNVLLYESIGYKIIPRFVKTIGERRVLFSHEPQEPDDWWEINIHGHIHNGAEHRQGERNFELGPEHINISIDVMDWKPIRLGELLDRIN